MGSHHFKKSILWKTFKNGDPPKGFKKAYFFLEVFREVVKNKNGFFTVRLTVRVDPPGPPSYGQQKKLRPLIMNIYGLKRILTFFLPFLTILGWA